MLEADLKRIFQNYLGEYLLSKDDVRKARANLKRIYQTKETMVDHLRDILPLDNKLNLDEITEELFQAAKLKTFLELDEYEAKIKE